jgi:hypothetical protein
MLLQERAWATAFPYAAATIKKIDLFGDVHPNNPLPFTTAWNPKCIYFYL